MAGYRISKKQPERNGVSLLPSPRIPINQGTCLPSMQPKHLLKLVRFCISEQHMDLYFSFGFAIACVLTLYFSACEVVCDMIY